MKVKVLPAAFAGDDVIQQALDAAASQMPAGSAPPSATPIRDASGKVVSVEVNLPSNAAAGDLTNAKNKINENPGVAKAQGFPLEYTQDAEGVANDATLNNLFTGVMATNSQALKGSTTAPIAGSVSLKRNNSLSNGGTYFGPWSDFGLSSASSIEMSCKLKTGASLPSGWANIGLITGSTDGFQSAGVWAFSNGQNIGVSGNGSQQGTADTGVAAATGTTYALKVRTYSNATFFYLDGTMVAELPSSIASSSGIYFGVKGVAGDDWLIDDIELKIWAGELT